MNEIREQVRAYVDKYLALNAEELDIVIDYAMGTWSEPSGPVKYLQFLAGVGSGNTTAGALMSNICAKPVIANGFASAYGIMYMMDQSYPCTLILDEADMVEEHEYADCDEEDIAMEQWLYAVLSVGAMKNQTVLRLQSNGAAKAYRVYGYKVLLCRKKFDSPALQSRCVVVQLESPQASRLRNFNDFQRDSQEIRWKLEDYFEAKGKSDL